MKIAILLYQNLRHAPFLKFYERVLHEMDNVEYEIIYLNRHPELEEPHDNNHIPISWIGKDDHNFLSKILTSATYSFRIRKILNKKKYDFIFVLTTTPGVLLEKYLNKFYFKRFLFDIRDYTKEHIKAFYNIENKVVHSSAINVVSSLDYLNFLPEGDYHICHNLNLPDVNEENACFEKSLSERVVISYVGNIQYEQLCIKLIKLVEKDERFEFHFYGAEGGSLTVTNYVNNLNDPRILMKGRFLPEDKKLIFSQSDIVFNCYGSESKAVKYAISNKYYDAAFYRRPLIVSPDTTMSRLTGDYAYALDLDNTDNLDELYFWYCNLNKDAFENYCCTAICTAMKENDSLVKLIKNTLKELTI